MSWCHCWPTRPSSNLKKVIWWRCWPKQWPQFRPQPQYLTPKATPTLKKRKTSIYSQLMLHLCCDHYNHYLVQLFPAKPTLHGSTIFVASIQKLESFIQFFQLSIQLHVLPLCWLQRFKSDNGWKAGINRSTWTRDRFNGAPTNVSILLKDYIRNILPIKQAR